MVNNYENTAEALMRLFKYEGKEPFNFYKGQKQIFKAIVLKTPKRLHVVTPTQYGKKISDDTPILTSNGWKFHGDLKIGDYVFSHNGKQVKVLNIFNDGVDVDREIEFTNGEKIKCHKNHEWLVAFKDWSRSKTPYRILETKQIENNKRLKEFSLSNIKPLDYKEVKLPIDPYTFGAWLGDGTTGEPVFNNSIEDYAIREKIPYKVSSESKHKKTGVITYRYYGQNLKYFKEVGKKHIPKEYLQAAIHQRLELLAGLIDTDGSVNKTIRKNGDRNGRVYIVNSNKQLIDDICELIQGLGMRVSITKVKAKLSTSGIQGKKDIYYVGFQPFINIPTAIERKKIIPLEKEIASFFSSLF